MPKFDDYTQKTTPEDTDIALILDKTANVNKKTPFSGIWTWIVNKMTNAVIQNLQTTNKTVIGSINELNSNIGRIGKNAIANADLFVYAKSCAEGITVFRTNNTVTNSPADYVEGYIIKMDNNITIACFNMNTTEMFLAQKQASSENFLPWKKALLQDLS